MRIKYGPFLVPSKDENMGMKQFLIQGMQLPCKDCYVTSFQAGLEFSDDGSYANANTSMWLHHIIILQPGAKDPVCPSAPHKRSLASGNERTFVDLTANG